MNTVNPINDFSTAKVDDKVTSIIYGKGIIVSINFSHEYPITVGFDTRTEISYTLNGRQIKEHNIPTLHKGHIEFDIIPKEVKPKYVPYSKPNYSLLGKIVINKQQNNKYIIVGVCIDNVYIIGYYLCNNDELFNDYVFEDGTPCGELIN